MPARHHTAHRPINPLPEPPPVTAAMARAHQRYWRFNLILIAALMTIGFCVSFGVPLFARGLSSVRFAGFSLPFYMGAQGAILIYLTLIVVYIALMQRADATLQRALDASNDGDVEADLEAIAQPDVATRRADR